MNASDQTRDPQTYNIIGAAMEVHRELGSGFLEAVYRDALAIEFELRGIPFQREVDLPVAYKGHELDARYRADFICYDRAVILETKALSQLSGNEEAQVINYLKATRIQVGLLLNFGGPSLQYKRYILTQHAKNRLSADCTEL
jgi:GxxExxY protein